VKDQPDLYQPSGESGQAKQRVKTGGCRLSLRKVRANGPSAGFAEPREGCCCWGLHVVWCPK